MKKPIVLLFSVFIFLHFNADFLFAQSTPLFSVKAGYYSQAQTLEITAEPDEVIYYTLNGDTPNENSSIYTSALLLSDRSTDQASYSTISNISHSYSPWVSPPGPIQLITVLRARTKKGDAWGKTATSSYIITNAGTQRYSIPVVSLTADSLSLFDYETGIYVLGKVYDDYKAANPNGNDGLSTPANYTERGDEWEKPAHFEFFEPNGNQALNMDIGIRIHGGGSRSFQQKSFRLYARKDYGESRFRYPFFLDQDLDEYKRLILRNSGQDWMKTALRDGFMQTLIRHLPFETMAFRQSLLFLNGEFWGIANIRERYDNDYLSIKFDIPDDEIDYLSNNQTVEEGDANHYKAMINYINAGSLSNQTRFDYVNTQMDTEGFMYYNLSNIFFNNRDWPHNNIEYWRLKTDFDPNAGPGKDGRWRWMLKDTDFGFAWTDIHRESTYQSHVTQNYLENASRSGHWSTLVLRALLFNDGFKNDFINTYRDLMNSAFDSTRTVHVLDSLKSVIEPYVAEHINRWGYSDHRWSMPHSVEEWNINIDYMRRFAREREIHVNEHFKEKFGLGDLYTVQVSVNDASMGYVQVNNLSIKPGTIGVQDYQYPAVWEGKYFETVPLTITAIPKDGYEFSHWENHESTLETIQITNESPLVYAHFKAKLVSNEEIVVHKANQTELFPNYPNPFNPSTTIHFNLAKAGTVSIHIYDSMGRLLEKNLQASLSSGIHTIPISMSNYATGFYVYKVFTPTGVLTGKMVLVK